MGKAADQSTDGSSRKGATPKDVPGAKAVPSWGAYWMNMAVAAGEKSKDPKCKVGAVIVRNNVIASTGFNGFARDLSDDQDLLADVEEKLKWMCHAEFNAIMNAARYGTALEGTTIYVTKFPCFACCNAIIQAGIDSLYTLDTKFWDDDPVDGDHSRKIAAIAQAGLKVTAPNHPHYSPKPRRPKSADLKPAVTVPPPSTKTRKSRRTAPKKDPKSNLNLFPARQTISGGRSED